MTTLQDMISTDLVSECCNATYLPDMQLCLKCKENCGGVKLT